MTMNNPQPKGTPAAPDAAGPKVYDQAAPAPAKPSGPGVYDAPARASGPPLGLIVGGVVALLIIALLLFQFVF